MAINSRKLCAFIRVHIHHIRKYIKFQIYKISSFSHKIFSLQKRNKMWSGWVSTITSSSSICSTSENIEGVKRREKKLYYHEIRHHFHILFALSLSLYSSHHKCAKKERMRSFYAFFLLRSQFSIHEACLTNNRSQFTAFYKIVIF